MTHLTTVLVTFLLFTTSAVYAQPVRSAPYTGNPTGTSSGNVLWSQLDDPTGSGFTDQAFEAPYAAYDSWGADDFVVADGFAWELESLLIPGEFTVAGANPAFVNVVFFSNVAGVHLDGCEFIGNTNFTRDGSDMTIDVSGCTAPGFGATWASHQVRMDFDPLGQHFWATRASAAGDFPAIWKNPGNGFGSGCVEWQPANAVCGMTGEDFLFELSGSEVIFGDGIPAVGPFGVVVLLLSLGAGSTYVLRRRQG
jgi:hypothetical protein